MGCKDMINSIILLQYNQVLVHLYHINYRQCYSYCPTLSELFWVFMYAKCVRLFELCPHQAHIIGINPNSSIVWIIPIVQPIICIVVVSYRSLTIFFRVTLLRLTHWGRVTHICVGNLTIIGSDNGLSPGQRQAIIWINAGILLIRP